MAANRNHRNHFCSHQDFTSQPRNVKVNKYSKSSRKPPRSKGLISTRPIAKKPFNAWIEHSEILDHGHGVCANQAALEEEAKLNAWKKEKEARLIKFRQDVVKRLQEFRSFEQGQEREQWEEANSRTYHKGSKFSVLQDTSNQPGKPKHAFCHEDQRQMSDTCSPLIASTAGSTVLTSLSEEIADLSKRVRQTMLTKMSTNDAGSLPGGLWYTSPTKDRDSVRNRNQVRQKQQQDEDNIQADASEDNPFENHLNDERTDNMENEEQGFTDCNHRSRKVQFADRVDVLRSPITSQASLRVATVKPTKTADVISSSRRFYMDMEREKAREIVRLKQQRTQIGRLKLQKEQQRQEVEQRLKGNAMALLNRESHFKQETTKSDEAQLYRAQLLARQESLKEAKKLDRYIDALQATVKDKMKYHQVKLPTLCSCGPTLWDTHPDRCANNCIFYKNPKAYARAISEILSDAKPIS